MTTQSFGSLAGWTQERGDWSVVSGGVKASADESGTDYHRWLLNNAAGTQNEDPSLRVKAWLGSASEDRRAFVIFSQGADWLGVAGFGHDAAMTVTSATASGGVRGEAGAILDAAKAVRRGAVALATFGADAYFDAIQISSPTRIAPTSTATPTKMMVALLLFLEKAVFLRSSGARWATSSSNFTP